MSRKKNSASRLNLLDLVGEPSQMSCSLTGSQADSPADEGTGQGIDEEDEQPASDAMMGSQDDEPASPSSSCEGEIGDGWPLLPAYAGSPARSEQGSEPAPSPTSTELAAEQGSSSPNGTLLTLATAYDNLPTLPSLSNKLTYRPLRYMSFEFESQFIPDSTPIKKGRPAGKEGCKTGRGDASDQEERDPAPVEAAGFPPSLPSHTLPAEGYFNSSTFPSDSQPIDSALAAADEEPPSPSGAADTHASVLIRCLAALRSSPRSF